MKLDLYKHKQFVIVIPKDDYDSWKEGKCLARKVDDFDRVDNILDDTISKQLSFEFETNQDTINKFNIGQIYDMFEDETADKIVKEYHRNEYGAHIKYNDGMYVTYDEFIKGLKHYGVEPYVHQLLDDNKVLLIYVIK